MDGRSSLSNEVAPRRAGIDSARVKTMYLKQAEKQGASPFQEILDISPLCDGVRKPISGNDFAMLRESCTCEPSFGRATDVRGVDVQVKSGGLQP